jgi:molecular chaperone DnaK (HSP70)
MKNKTLMAAAATTLAVGTLGVVGALGITQAYAQEVEDGEAPLIIQNLADAFGVSEDAVKEVFEATREERQDNRLDELVEDGTLTQEQRDALEAKQDEHRDQMKEIKDSDMTDEEKKEAIESLRDEMETWMEEQGIDIDDIRPERSEGGKGMRGGMGGPRGEMF